MSLAVAPTVTASFLASFVEAVEALTVVLAVGVTRGWRGALGGAGLGLVLLLALVAAFGPWLTALPATVARLGVGTLILLFGARWLRKAMLRSAGALARRDEAAAFARQTAALRGGAAAGWDRVAVVTSCQITLLEGLEVVFIVIALGGGGRMLGPACLGAAAAVLVVAALGVALHRPLSLVPENTLKFCVGVLLCAFGAFWVGEGLGVAWPGDDAALPVLIAWFAAVALAGVALARRRTE